MDDRIGITRYAGEGICAICSKHGIHTHVIKRLWPVGDNGFAIITPTAAPSG